MIHKNSHTEIKFSTKFHPLVLYFTRIKVYRSLQYINIKFMQLFLLQSPICNETFMKFEKDVLLLILFNTLLNGLHRHNPTLLCM